MENVMGIFREEVPCTFMQAMASSACEVLQFLSKDQGPEQWGEVLATIPKWEHGDNWEEITEVLFNDFVQPAVKQRWYEITYLEFVKAHLKDELETKQVHGESITMPDLMPFWYIFMVYVSQDNRVKGLADPETASRCQDMYATFASLLRSALNDAVEIVTKDPNLPDPLFLTEANLALHNKRQELAQKDENARGSKRHGKPHKSELASPGSYGSHSRSGSSSVSSISSPDEDDDEEEEVPVPVAVAAAPAAVVAPVAAAALPSNAATRALEEKSVQEAADLQRLRQLIRHDDAAGHPSAAAAQMAPPAAGPVTAPLSPMAFPGERSPTLAHIQPHGNTHALINKNTGSLILP